MQRSCWLCVHLWFACQSSECEIVREREVQCKQKPRKKNNSLQIKSECKMPVSLRFSSFCPLNSPYTALFFVYWRHTAFLFVCVLTLVVLLILVFFEFIQLSNSLFLLRYSRNGLDVNIRVIQFNHLVRFIGFYFIRITPAVLISEYTIRFF